MNWATRNRLQGQYRKKFRPIFMAAFEKQIQPLYEVIRQTSNIQNVRVPVLSNEPIEKAYEKLYLKTATDAAKRDRAEWKIMAGLPILKDEEDEIMDDIIMGKIQSYLKTDLGSQITAVGDTSVELIQKLLDELIPEIIESGVGAGEAQTMLRDRIESAWHKARYYRTERIVRTEVNRAHNFGSIEGIRSLGIPMEKEWLPSGAADPREWHQVNDVVDINEPFMIGGEALDYPVDPAGSPENTINCSCGIVYRVKK